MTPAMEVIRYDDPAAFIHDGAPVLGTNAARNNLPVSILDVLLDQPEVYPTFHLWMAMRDGRPRGLALQTEPFGIVLAEPLDDDVVEGLVDAVILDAGPLPSVIGNLPWVDRFAERVIATTGRTAVRLLNEGMWELTAVADVPVPNGAARLATPDDRELLRTWTAAFEGEAIPPATPVRTEAATDLVIDLRLEGRGGGYWLWEDGTPVALAGFRVIRGVGSRIGPVYTPPEYRRRGYATRLVAELSASRLAQGDPACFLTTDLSNPTSNAIYARIGYVKVCDAVEYGFHAEP